MGTNDSVLPNQLVCREKHQGGANATEGSSDLHSVYWTLGSGVSFLSVGHRCEKLLLVFVLG